MFFRKQARESNERSSQLTDVVARAIPNADADTRSIVIAIVGLAGVIAYADRDFSNVEKQSVRKLLGTVDGIDDADAARVVDTLSANIVSISTTEAPRHARTLVQLAERDLRLHVLELLLDVATSDHELQQEEVVVLRQITKSLGLEQRDYNQLQSKHKALLAALK